MCNKIGTYLKALAARANGVPFDVALPSPSIDLSLRDGLREIPIEERPGAEVAMCRAATIRAGAVKVQIAPDGTPARNPAFDATPAHLITERGVCAATAQALAAMWPDRAGQV